MKRWSVGAGCLLFAIAAACSDGAPSTSSGGATATRVEPFMHAMVRIPEGTQSSLLQECGGAIRRLPESEVGARDFWLVYMPKRALDELSQSEGLEWRPL